MSGTIKTSGLYARIQQPSYKKPLLMLLENFGYMHRSDGIPRLLDLKETAETSIMGEQRHVVSLPGCYFLQHPEAVSGRRENIEREIWEGAGGLE